MKLLHSKIIGQGMPLLILHGYFGMGDNWKSHANRFAKNYEVHLIDQRNHGRSFHSDIFNYDLMVADLYHYIQYNRLKNIYLLGHSMGGKTAMLFSVKYPKLINKLVVVDMSPKRYPPHHQTILKALNSIDFSVYNSRKKIDTKLAEIISEVSVRQFLLKNTYWKQKDKLAFRFNLKSLTQNNKEVGKALPKDTFFKGKTLFLKGEQSKYISKDDELLIKIHFPNSKIIVVKNTGHWVHAENPKDFYDEVLKFLQN